MSENDRNHPNKTIAEVALSYIPSILQKLDGDATVIGMFAEVLQAMRIGGYQDGFEDGVKSQSGSP
jgi:hypothetical protein